MGAEATLVVISGFDAVGKQQHGPVTLPRAARHILEGVPVTVVRISLDYRSSSGGLVARSSAPVQVSANALTQVPTLATSSATRLLVTNSDPSASPTPTTVWVTLQAQTSIPGSVNQLTVVDTASGTALTVTPFPTPSPGATPPLVGWFSINPNQTVEIANPNQNGTLTGFNLGFGPAEPSCPCTTCQSTTPFVSASPMPNGINVFEASLNLTDETVDISCTNGANSKLAVNLSGGGNWNDGAAPNTPVTSFENSWVNVAGAQDDNCSRIGVFPMNATACTSAGSPIPCSGTNGGVPFCVAATAHCQVMRNNSAGGTVTVVFKGAIAPP